MKAKKGDPIKKGLQAKGDFYQSLEPEYKKIYMKHLDDAINRGISVSDAASSAVSKVNKAKEEAKVAKKNIKNFVGDRKYEKGGKVFKPHNMYKDGKKVVAKTMADHLRLKKKGYSHKKG